MEKDMYIDITAAFVSIRNLLIEKGICTNEEFVEAFQEQLLRTRSVNPTAPLPLMDMFSRGHLKHHPNPPSQT